VWYLQVIPGGKNTIIMFSLYFCYIKVLEVFYKVLFRSFYRCKNWYLLLRKEQRLRVLEKKVLRRIFGPKKQKTTEG
jgi:hypothetical protein